MKLRTVDDAENGGNWWMAECNTGIMVDGFRSCITTVDGIANDTS